MKRYTAKTVIATEFSWDVADLDDYRYHYGRTSKPVYGIGQKVFCATPQGQKPATHRDGDFQWDWKEYKSRFAASIGWVIWEA